MCGISGIINKNKKSVSTNDIKKMNDVISHRGPDDEGFYFENNLAFGHRRLSILDLSSLGHQPMEFLDSYVITYNGEIYNYIELREELLKLGYKFKTQTDTEVILACYDKWGEECLHKFNGMWSFAIYDKKRETIFCSRDRFGVKPFYYYENSEIFSFASEIKQFKSLDSFVAVSQKEVVYNFLANSIFDYNELTFFKGVKQLMGGYKLTYNLITNSCSTKKWYELQDTKEEEQSFLELFKESIKLRLRSDVKVGSCLSGGLDSSSIVSVVNDEILDKTNQEVVSACYDNKKYDESEYIDVMVKERDLISHKIFPNLDKLLNSEFLKNTIYTQDTPYSTTSIFSQYSVFEEAKKNGLKVMLDGQGADETLCGYHSFFAPFLASYLKKLQIIKFYNELTNIKKEHKVNTLFLLLQVFNTLLPKSIKKMIKKNKYNFINQKEFVNIKNKTPFIDFGERESSVDVFSKAQLFHTNLPLLLHYADRNSMTHSIEARLPFLDYKLVEFIISLSDEQKIKNGVTKNILRESLKGIVPSEILDRKDKMGFVTPESVWAKDHKDFFREELKRAVSKSKYINETILEEFEGFVSGDKNYDSVYWRVITYINWIEVFGVIEE